MKKAPCLLLCVSIVTEFAQGVVKINKMLSANIYIDTSTVNGVYL